MKIVHLLTSAAVAALATTALPAYAQSDITGQTAINDRIDDIDREVATQLNRSQDTFRFGSPDLRPGLSGSASLGFNAASGNTDSTDLTLGARLRYSAGPYVQLISFAIDYANENDIKTKRDIIGVYDGNYFFNDQFYGFVLGRVSSDGLAKTAAETHTDAFLGFGPGYRVINTAETTLRLQAGVGLSYLEDGADNSDTEIGYIVSARFYRSLGPNVFLTNDTDILKSDTALRINNDLGLNFKVSDSLSTRMSYLTEYNDNRAIRSDNKLGVAVVYGF